MDWYFLEIKYFIFREYVDIKGGNISFYFLDCKYVFEDLNLSYKLKNKVLGFGLRRVLLVMGKIYDLKV